MHVILSEGVGEPLRDGRGVALLPETDHDQLVAFLPADEHEVALLQVAHEQRAPVPGLAVTCGKGTCDPCGDLGALLETSSDPLPVALDGMICDSNEHVCLGFPGRLSVI